MEDKLEANQANKPKEIYRKIVLSDLSEHIQPTKENNNVNSTTESNSKSKTESNPEMVQDEIAVNDGADEQMLGTEDNGKLTEKRDEVKFIKGDHQNGDAKVDIGAINGKTFTGMTKEELMKYANDPFWIRLRWIFFIGFWAIWIAMLVGAIVIIVKAPKCSAPKPRHWYECGPHAKFSYLDSLDDEDVVACSRVHAAGVIYELPPELTYSIKDSVVEEKIKNIVAKFKEVNTFVIMDITPNYVSKESALMQAALADENKRSPFIWIKQDHLPTDWQSIKNATIPAWSEMISGHYVLTQFGDGLYDLRMNDTTVKKELENNLRHLIQLGVRGIRLKNTKYFWISKNIDDKSDQRFHNTDFQIGLGDVLEEYSKIVKNSSSEAFLSVTDAISYPEVYKTKEKTFGFELPIYGHFVHLLGTSEGSKLEYEMGNITKAVGNETWMQWDLNDLITSNEERTDVSALALYIALLRGVPVLPMSSNLFNNVSETTFKHIEQLRHSPSFMHGDFQMYTNENLVAYSRIKSGNPGYFVVFNPTNTSQPGNFTNLGLPDKMTVDALSSNYNVTDISVKTKLTINSLTMSPHSTMILTYVPIKSG